jgi:hypothetical protein
MTRSKKKKDVILRRSGAAMGIKILSGKKPILMRAKIAPNRHALDID